MNRRTSGLPLGYKFKRIKCPRCGRAVGANYIKRHLQRHKLEDAPLPKLELNQYEGVTENFMRRSGNAYLYFGMCWRLETESGGVWRYPLATHLAPQARYEVSARGETVKHHSSAEGWYVWAPRTRTHAEWDWIGPWSDMEQAINYHTSMMEDD